MSAACGKAAAVCSKIETVFSDFWVKKPKKSVDIDQLSSYI